jgi:PKD repeat protein
MKPAPAPKPCCHPEGAVPSPCHPERARLAVARGIRNLSALLLLFPLALLAVSCEDLPPPPATPNIPPVASFIFNPVSPVTAGATPVSFNASGSRDSDGTIANYNWAWGDGTPDQSTTSPTIVHVFPDTPSRCVEAVYAVLLTVVDDQGGLGTASLQVRVIELPEPSSAACR